MSLLCHHSTAKPKSNSPEPELFHRLRLQLESPAPAPQHWSCLRLVPLAILDYVIMLSILKEKIKSNFREKQFYFKKYGTVYFSKKAGTKCHIKKFSVSWVSLWTVNLYLKSGSTKLLNTGPIRIRIYVQHWVRAYLEQPADHPGDGADTDQPRVHQVRTLHLHPNLNIYIIYNTVQLFIITALPILIT